jgi:hypothetical protein
MYSCVYEFQVAPALHSPLKVESHGGWWDVALVTCISSDIEFVSGMAVLPVPAAMVVLRTQFICP